jgi:hypothetical protein
MTKMIIYVVARAAVKPRECESSVLDYISKRRNNEHTRREDGAGDLFPNRCRY